LETELNQLKKKEKNKIKMLAAARTQTATTKTILSTANFSRFFLAVYKISS
jgi:hypothetical protein